MSVLFTRRGIAQVGGSGGGVSGTLGSDLEIGSSVFLNINGTLKEFLIVHQGKPSSMYDDSCDGTWLLMKDTYGARAWHSSDVNDYENSSIHTYLNGTFWGLFDEDVQSAIKQVKIPYRKGSGYSTTITSGSSGLSAKVFLLSGTEVGFSAVNYMATGEGAKLSYFADCASSGEDIKRVAYNNGTAKSWWLRSPVCNQYVDTTNDAWTVSSSNGTQGAYECSRSTVNFRPALILPSNAVFDPSTKEFVGVA